MKNFQASLYKTERGREFKTCPCCSQREGRHVFYPVSAFGLREMDGRILIQAWCVTCRAAAGSLSRKKKGA